MSHISNLTSPFFQSWALQRSDIWEVLLKNIDQPSLYTVWPWRGVTLYIIRYVFLNLLLKNLTSYVVEMPPERKVLWFFSEGQIVRISLSLIPNAPWVCLSKSSIPAPDSYYGGYTPPGPNCVQRYKVGMGIRLYETNYVIHIVKKNELM